MTDLSSPFSGPLPEPRFIRTYPPARPAPGLAYWLPFYKGDLVLQGDRLIHAETPLLRDGNDVEGIYYLGTLDGVPCLTYALTGDDVELPDGYRAVGLRALYGVLGDAEYGLSGYAAQILHWERDHLYCEHCGGKVEPEEGTWGKKCPKCGRTAYPPVVPAVLLLIHDGADRVLLAQKAGWGKRYSIIAGFVEPGESLEDCCIRESREEVSVLVDRPLYAGSQPWPFPHQVMIGFTTRYLAGEIKIEEAELSHAAWFRYDELPELPPALSLSRQIIDGWVAGRRAIV